MRDLLGCLGAAIFVISVSLLAGLFAMALVWFVIRPIATALGWSPA